MQIIVNCLAPYAGGIVMLRKPRRGWWVLPGGKVDADETWPEAAQREVWEEAGLRVGDLRLRGVYHLHIASTAEHPQGIRRLIAQFSAGEVSGELRSECREGMLDVIHPDRIAELPMDDGDRIMLRRTLESIATRDDRVYFGKFAYTADHALIQWHIEPR